MLVVYLSDFLSCLSLSPLLQIHLSLTECMLLVSSPGLSYSRFLIIPLSVFRSTRMSNGMYIKLCRSVCLPIYLPIYPHTPNNHSTHSPTHSPIRQLVCQQIHPTIYPYNTCISICHSIRLSIYSFIHPSIHSQICLSLL